MDHVTFSLSVPNSLVSSLPLSAPGRSPVDSAEWKINNLPARPAAYTTQKLYTSTHIVELVHIICTYLECF